MRIAFDHNVPRQLRRLLTGHFVQTASESEWAVLSNGDLLRKAQESSFDILLTCDSDFLRYRDVQRTIAILCLSTNHWPSLMQADALIRSAIERAAPGSFEQIVIQQKPAANV